MHLIDPDALEVTIRHVMEAKRIVLEESPHPLTPLIMRAKERIKGRNREDRAQMIEMYRKDQVTIDDLLRDGYWSDETQEGIRNIRKLCERNEWRYRREERRVKKRVWDRVYRRIRRSGLSVEKTKAKWWLPE